MGDIQKIVKFFDRGDDSDDDLSSEEDSISEEDGVMTENTVLYIFLVLVEMWYGGEVRINLESLQKSID
jgi:hypothetical protein